MDKKALKYRFAIEWLIIFVIVLSCFVAGNVKYGIKHFFPEPEVQRQSASEFLGLSTKQKTNAITMEQMHERKRLRPGYWSEVNDVMVVVPIIWLFVLIVRITIWSVRIVKSRSH